MRRLLFCLLICLWCPLDNSPAAQAQGDPASEVIRLVNELRATYGVPPYQVDEILMSVAQAQASWSAANNHIGHDGPGGSSPNDRAQAAGYGNGARSFATENAAHGTLNLNTPDLVVRMWQGDWGHLNAMISADYEHIGVGYAEAYGHSWYVMMVGWVAGDSPPSNTGVPETVVETVPDVPFVLSEPDETGAIYHEVQPGQTAWTIAAYYGVDVAELLELNGLTEDSILHPGDILLVSAPVSPTNTPLPQTPTEAAHESPTAPAHFPSATPTPSPETNSRTSRGTKHFSPYLIVGLGILILAGIAGVTALASRNSSQ
jgi:LysM repeat protein